MGKNTIEIPVDIARRWHEKIGTHGDALDDQLASAIADVLPIRREDRLELPWNFHGSGVQNGEGRWLYTGLCDVAKLIAHAPEMADMLTKFYDHVSKTDGPGVCLLLVQCSDLLRKCRWTDE